MRRELQAPLGFLVSWGRREKKVTMATPSVEEEGNPVPQDSQDLQGQREKLVLKARLVPQDSKETRGSLEHLESRAQLVPRVPRENQGKQRWKITMGTSMRLSRRFEHWP